MLVTARTSVLRFAANGRGAFSGSIGVKCIGKTAGLGVLLWAVLVVRPVTGEEAGALRWGADAEGGAPYIFIDPQHPEQNQGFEVDLAAALAKELKRPIRFQPYQFVNLSIGLKRRDIDFAMNGLEMTEERRQQVRFSRPYYIFSEQLVVRAREDRFQTFEECAAVNRREPLKIGTLAQTAADNILRDAGFAPVTYENQTDPYKDLELGRLDGVLLDTPIALYYAKPNPQLRLVGPRFGHGHYGIAFRKDEGELVEQFDAALGRLLQAGELRRIYEKWGIWNEDQVQLYAERDVIGETAKQLTLRVYLPLLCKGARMTVFLSLAGMLVAVLLGMVLAVLRLYGPRPVQWLATAYIEFFRGVPVLLLLFFIYYGLPEIAAQWRIEKWLTLNAVQAAILAFGLNYAAFEAEIYRAGIAAIPEGQWEAAASLGMSRAQAFWRVILPQAIRTILPPTTNDFVALFKDTSLVNTITVVELTTTYQSLTKSSLKYFEIGLITAVLYLVMSVPLGLLSRYLEKRWNRELYATGAQG